MVQFLQNPYVTFPNFGKSNLGQLPCQLVKAFPGRLPGTHEQPAQAWRERFFAQPRSLPAWITANGWQHPILPETPAGSRFAVVMTMSPLHINLVDVLKELVPGLVCVAVDALTSELDLEKKLQDFSSSHLPPGSVLVLQCRAHSPHVELVRHRVYSQLPENRRALLLLHGNRKVFSASAPGSRLQTAADAWSPGLLFFEPRSTSQSLSIRLNFQSGWSQVGVAKMAHAGRALEPWLPLGLPGTARGQGRFVDSLGCCH